MLLVLRNPIDRLETSFWAHPQYPKRYGASSEGVHAYVVEQAGHYRFTCHVLPTTDY